MVGLVNTLERQRVIGVDQHVAQSQRLTQPLGQFRIKKPVPREPSSLMMWDAQSRQAWMATCRLRRTTS